jgi:hypothetical protein
MGRQEGRRQPRLPDEAARRGSPRSLIACGQAEPQTLAVFNDEVAVPTLMAGSVEAARATQCTG